VITPEQRELLRRDFEIQLPLPLRFGVEVYEQLGELDPALAPAHDLLEQRAMQLAEALTAGIVVLIDEGKVPDSLRRFGLRLRGDGVLGRDYDTLGRALLALFERRLGDELTPEGREAWIATWDLFSTEMQKAAMTTDAEE